MSFVLLIANFTPALKYSHQKISVFSDRLKFNEIEGNRGKMMRSSECIAKDLGYYFIGDGQIEEFLTPWMVK